jgi:hypothetical protein
MSPIVEKGLDAITIRTNLSTGLAHPNDMNAAKEMFALHAAGEILLANEIEAWAAGNGWQTEDAAELGNWAPRLGWARSRGLRAVLGGVRTSSNGSKRKPTPNGWVPLVGLPTSVWG